MTPVVQQAGESLTDEEVITMYSTWNDRAGSSYAELIQDAYALGRHRALASRPQQPQAETPLTAELLRDLKMQYGMVGTRDVDVAAWNAKLDRAIAALASALQAEPVADLYSAPNGHVSATVRYDTFSQVGLDMTRPVPLYLHPAHPNTAAETPLTEPGPRAPAGEPTETLWKMAEAIRDALDRQSCPGAYLTVAWQAAQKYIVEHPAAPWPEDTAEQFIQAAINNSPEPLQNLGELLSRVLDEDQFKTAEGYLLALATLSNTGAETPLTDEQIDRFLVNFGEVPQLRKSLTKWCRMLVRAALTEFAGAHPPEAVSREDFDKLSADLTRAKNLLVRLHSKFPETRSQIEGSTGTWFIWGTDRDAASPPEARAAAGWISVEEKMPEPDSGEVLVWLTGGRCAFDEWHTHREDPTGMSTTHTIDMGLMWRDYEFEDITHWMPLPLPPEAQEPKT